VKTWAQILRDDESRLRFYQLNLNYKAGKSLAIEYWRARYKKYLAEIGANGSKVDLPEEEPMEDEPMEDEPAIDAAAPKPKTIGQ
jgi:hypothetical protein